VLRRIVWSSNKGVLQDVTVSVSLDSDFHRLMLTTKVKVEAKVRSQAEPRLKC
jgi:hypothetical protein